ncbi:MAG: glycosyltransferase family 9 protein [Bdellovibrionota bacterium]
MNFQWMRRIDAWIGKPLLWLAGLFVPRPLSLFGDTAVGPLPERVICTKFIGMGSVVLSLPLLKALKEQGVKVAFWSFPGQAEIVRLAGLADEIWILRPSFRSFLPSLFMNLAQAWRFRPQAFLDLEPTANFTALLAVLTRSGARVGLMSAKPLRERVFSHLVAMAPERHMVENYLWMGLRLGLDLDRTTADFPPAPRLPFHQIPSTSKQRIVVNPNSSELSWHRMWSEDHWVSLCRRLLEDPGVELVFPGTRSERARCERIVRALGAKEGRVQNLAGQTDLAALLALLQTAGLVISVDSGILHLAAWAGVPVIGLYGPETPNLFGPRSPDAIALRAGLPCSPCLSVAVDKVTQCRDNQCMKRIHPETVFNAANRLLKGGHHAPAKKTA